MPVWLCVRVAVWLCGCVSVSVCPCQPRGDSRAAGVSSLHLGAPLRSSGLLSPSRGSSRERWFPAAAGAASGTCTRAGSGAVQGAALESNLLFHVAGPLYFLLLDLTLAWFYVLGLLEFPSEPPLAIKITLYTQPCTSVFPLQGSLGVVIKRSISKILHNFNI